MEGQTIASAEDVLQQVEALSPYPPPFEGIRVAYRGEDTCDPERDTTSQLVRSQARHRNPPSIKVLCKDIMCLLQEAHIRLWGGDPSTAMGMMPFQPGLGLPDGIERKWKILRNRILACPTSLRLLTDLQHFGCPTPLIDGTRDPRVALFFASRGCSQRNGIVFYADLDEVPFINKLESILPDMTAARVRQQKSVLLFPYGPSIPFDAWHRHVCVPAALKGDILKLLEEQGVSEKTLFPDIYGAATHLRRHFELRQSPSRANAKS